MVSAVTSSQASSFVSAEGKLKEKRFICFLYRNLLKLCRCYDEHPALKFSLVNPRNTKSRNLITRGWTKTQLGQFILSQVYRDPKSFFYTPPGANFEKICKSVFRKQCADNHDEEGNFKFTKNDAMEVCFGLQSEMNLNIEKTKKLMVVRKFPTGEKSVENMETQPIEFSLVDTTEPKKFHILVSHPMLTDIVFERTCFVMTDNKQRVASILGKRAHELRRKKKRKKIQKQLPSMTEEHVLQTLNEEHENNSSASTVSNSENNSTSPDNTEKEPLSKTLEAHIETFPNDPNLLISKIPLTFTPLMPQTPDTFQYDDDNFSNNPVEDNYDPNDEYDDNDSNEFEYDLEDTANDEMLSVLEEESQRYLENLLKELEARQRLASWRKGQLSSEIQHGKFTNIDKSFNVLFFCRHMDGSHSG